MTQTDITNHLLSAVDYVSQNIHKYVYRPGKDFTRNSKFSIRKLFPFLVFAGSSSTRNELAEAFDFDANHPSMPALVQQRAKLKPEGLAEVFYEFNRSIDALNSGEEFHFLAVDGSTVTFLSNPSLSDDAYFTKQGSSEKGCYSIHATASYSLSNSLFTDCVLQPITQKDEYRAFAEIVDRHPLPEQSSLVFVADRGFCSYNNMAHVIERNQFFLIRAKDINSKGLLHNLRLPNTDSFDTDVQLILIRKHSKSMKLPEGEVRFIDKDTSFDFLEYGSPDYYVLNFRLARFEINPGKFEALVTNLPRDKFPLEELKELYHLRWNEETAFRHLKYATGLTKFHSSKPKSVMQEIWARLIYFNYTNALINSVAIVQPSHTKHTYKINFSCAVSKCRQFFRSFSRGSPINVAALLLKALIPIRNHRSYPRLQTAHFRRPAYFLYRAS